MAEKLTIDNLENGVDFARKNGSPTKDTIRYGDPEEGELTNFAKRNAGTIFEVKLGDEIDCNKYNYYYESRAEQPDGGYRGTYTKKISSEYDVRQWINKNKKVYRVERKNRPFGEGFANRVTGFFKKSDAPAAPAADTAAPAADTAAPAADAAAPAADAAPTGDANPAATGGRRSRRSRNQRKSRKSRKQRNERKSRKQRRSRR